MLLQGLKTLYEKLINERRFTAALTACDEVLNEKLSPKDRCDVLQLKARAVIAEDGRWNGPAITSLKEALGLTKPASVDRARVLVSCTAAYAALGSVSYCLEARNAFVQILQEVNSKTLAKLHPAVEYNLGLAYHETDQLDEAESAYLTAFHLAQELKDACLPEVRNSVQNNLIDVFQELGRHEEAKSLMEPLFAVLPDESHGAQIRNRRAIYALHKGDISSAVLWVESGLGHRSCTYRTRCALMLTKARIAKEAGHLEDAHDCALEALRLAAIVHSSRLGQRTSQFLNGL